MVPASVQRQVQWSCQLGIYGVSGARGDWLGIIYKAGGNIPQTVKVVRINLSPYRLDLGFQAFQPRGTRGEGVARDG